MGWNTSNPQCDIDLSAYLLDSSGKVPGDDWFVFRLSRVISRIMYGLLCRAGRTPAVRGLACTAVDGGQILPGKGVLDACMVDGQNIVRIKTSGCFRRNV